MVGLRTYGLLMLLLLMSVVAIYSVYGCFDPTDTFSGAVVLNKPGITYNLTILEKSPDVVKLEDNAYMYRSHIGEAVIILYLEGFKDGAPVYGGQEPSEYYLGVRIELLNVSLDNVTGSINEYKENATKWLRNIMSYELK